jgi:hypothetical protein
MYGAYRFLKGSISWADKQRLNAILRGEVEEKPAEEVEAA